MNKKELDNLSQDYAKALAKSIDDTAHKVCMEYEFYSRMDKNFQAMIRRVVLWGVGKETFDASKNSKT